MNKVGHFAFFRMEDHMVFTPDTSIAYSWTPGSHHNVSAEVAGAVCSELESKGRLTPHDLVEVSRPDDAPLHSEFEWDDTAAAELYRESQGAYIIRSIEFKIDEHEESEPIRVFFPTHEKDDDGKSLNRYANTTLLVSKKDSRETLLNDAYIELRAFERKYRELTEFASLFEEIRKMLESAA